MFFQHISIHMEQFISDNVEQMYVSTFFKTYQISPTPIPKGPKRITKHVQTESGTYPKTVSVRPRIEPGTLRIRLPDRSEDQPIGLIPSQERGSPRISYVSKCFVPRSNIVAENAFFKNKILSLQKISIVLLWYMPAGAFPSLRKTCFQVFVCITVVCSNLCAYIAVVFFIIAHPGYQSRIKSRWYFFSGGIF